VEEKDEKKTDPTQIMIKQLNLLSEKSNSLVETEVSALVDVSHVMVEIYTALMH
jgi:hypothetical protein